MSINGTFLLHYFIENDETDEALKEIDASELDDLNAKFAKEKTPLICAASHGNKEVVIALLERGVDLDEKDSDGYTALMYAIKYDYREVFNELIESGVNTDITTKDKRTPLMLAIESPYDNQPMIETLINENIFSLNKQSEDGKTPLILAAIHDKKDTVQKLVQQNVHLDICDMKGKSALIYAVENGNIDIARILIENGAFINKQKSYSSQRPLTVAIQNDQTEMVKYLLSAGAAINIQEGYTGKTELMMAASNGNIKIVKTLLENGADLNVKDKEGKTALQILEEDKSKYDEETYEQLHNLLTPKENPSQEQNKQDSKGLINTLNKTSEEELPFSLKSVKKKEIKSSPNFRFNLYDY